MNEAQTIQRMVDFLESIGIPVVDGEVPEGTFLPGILIDNGRLVVDQANLRYPGDLLHEAGYSASPVGCGEHREPHRSRTANSLERCGSLRSPHPTGLNRCWQSSAGAGCLPRCFVPER